MRTGVHCSVRKGFVGALQEAAALGCQTFQMFTQSPRGWMTRVYADEEFTDFRRERAELGLSPVVVHAPYLPNLCTSAEELYQKSIRALKADLDRCEKLGAEYLVVHPGAYSETADLETGVARIVDALNEGLAAVPGTSKILIENMAGGGRRVGGPFRQIAQILDKVEQPDRIGVCFDTCHALAAGYDITNKSGVAETLKEFDEEIGLERIHVFHVNDSKGNRGSHRDMHQHLGKGYVGLPGLKALFSSHDFSNCAFILETPKDPMPTADFENLKKAEEFTVTAEAPLPPLKASIEAIQIEHEGQPMVLLRDQEGLNQQSIAVTMAAFFIAMMLDGHHSVSDVQTEFSKNTGALIKPEEIQSLVTQFEKADLLETEALKEKRRHVMKQFIENPNRPAAHIHTGYPETPLDLAAMLGKYFQDPKGPLKQVPAEPVEPTPIVLIAPHIDFHRGGPAYAWAYQALGSCQPPDVIVGLGVAHMSPNSPWVLCPKNYETPYGALPYSKDLYQDFQTSLWYEASTDQWTHRTEHSLEFQALWLKYLWRDKTPPWVPVLCSSFDRFCPDRAPSSISTIDDGVNKIGEKLKARQAAGQKILILAGVDLAHVGPRFGDQEKLGPELEKRVEEEDRKSLELALKGEADAMYLSVVKDNHWRKWCGLSAIYTALRLMKILSPEKLEGQLLTYGQAPDPMGGLVSFASAIFPRG